MQVYFFTIYGLGKLLANSSFELALISLRLWQLLQLALAYRENDPYRTLSLSLSLSLSSPHPLSFSQCLFVCYLLLDVSSHTLWRNGSRSPAILPTRVCCVLSQSVISCSHHLDGLSFASVFYFCLLNHFFLMSHGV